MKRIFSLLISFALILSCSKDSVDPTPTPEPITRYTIQFQAGAGGSVSTSGGSFDKGATISVTAIPDGEYLFDSWSDGSTENPREITVTSNLNLTANFVRKKYNLTVNIDGEGTVEEEIIVQGSTSNTEYNSGTTVKLTAIASDEWVFTGWSGDVESTDNPIEVTMSESKEITATFSFSVLSANGFLKLGDFNSHQYYYKEQEVSFDQAREIANTLSVDLLTITTEAEQDFVTNILTSKGLNDKNWWLGLTDVDNEGIWKWLNGEEFSYSNWNSGNPNNTNSEENYVHIEGPNCKWNDYKSSGRPNNSPIFIIVEF